MKLRKATMPQYELNELETHLAGTLRRIAPSGELARRLRERIHMPAPREIAMRLGNWQHLLFVFGGVMSGLLVIITIARAFYHLMGRRDVG